MHDTAVWGTRSVVVNACPKSLVTPASMEMVELYLAWKWSGEMDLLSLPAKHADALLVLEQESRKEFQDGR